MIQRTLVLIKPDGVARGLVGSILHRFETIGLKIIALKMVWATREHVDKHYPESDEWFSSVGSRTSAFLSLRQSGHRDGGFVKPFWA